MSDEPAARGRPSPKCVSPRRGERLERALQDALRADVDPRAGGHLAVHHQAARLELAEVAPRSPSSADEVRVRDQHARRVGVRPEDADRLARLHEQRLVVARARAARATIASKPPSCARPCRCRRRRRDPRGRSATSGSRLFMQHAQRGFLHPALAGELVPRGARGSRPFPLPLARVRRARGRRVGYTPRAHERPRLHLRPPPPAEERAVARRGRRHRLPLPRPVGPRADARLRAPLRDRPLRVRGPRTASAPSASSSRGRSGPGCAPSRRVTSGGLARSTAWSPRPASPGREARPGQGHRLLRVRAARRRARWRRGFRGRRVRHALPLAARLPPHPLPARRRDHWAGATSPGSSGR